MQSVSCFTSRGGGVTGTPIIVRKEEIRIKDRPSRVGATTAVRQRHKLTEHYLQFERVPDINQPKLQKEVKETVRHIHPVQIKTVNNQQFPVKNEKNVYKIMPMYGGSSPLHRHQVSKTLTSLLVGEEMISKGPYNRPANAQGTIEEEESESLKKKLNFALYNQKI